MTEHNGFFCYFQYQKKKYLYRQVYAFNTVYHSSKKVHTEF